MKVDTKELYNTLKKLCFYSEEVEFCDNEIRVHGRCECPNYPCSDFEHYGQCCTDVESLIYATTIINDDLNGKIIVLDDEEKMDMFYQKTPCLQFEKVMDILLAMHDTDCLIGPGKISFIDKRFMKHKYLCELNML